MSTRPIISIARRPSRVRRVLRWLGDPNESRENCARPAMPLVLALVITFGLLFIGAVCAFLIQSH